MKVIVLIEQKAIIIGVAYTLSFRCITTGIRSLLIEKYSENRLNFDYLPP